MKTAVLHPLKTLKSLCTTIVDTEKLDFHSERKGNFARKPDLLGLGFCLKPIKPACPSLRPNHDCQYFDRLSVKSNNRESLPAACRGCQIRIIGTDALLAGIPVYIMTSARDILYDLLLPGRKHQKFIYGCYVMCRYSMLPFRFALHSCGLGGRLFPYYQGDCKDFRSWRAADIGIKNEQTVISDKNICEISEAFTIFHQSRLSDVKVEIKKHIYYPTKWEFPNE